MEKVLVIGASGHAKVVIEAIELGNTYQIHGLIDSYKKVGTKLLGYEILGNESLIPELISKGINKAIIAIGDNWTRHALYERVSKQETRLEFITVIHPKATVSKYATVGKGTVILASGVVKADGAVGDFCIINTNAAFGHDTIMKDFSSLAPGTAIGGNVYIGEFTAISIGATVIQNISIGAHTVIGAGATVTRNIDEYTIAYGTPAKMIRKRTKGEVYLGDNAKDENFNIYEIRNSKDIEKYRSIIESLNVSNPFYKTELLDTTDMNIHQLCYFVFFRNKKPVIVMPFYLRKIYENGEDTTYRDVISPYGYSGPLFNKKELMADDITFFWEQVDFWYKKKKVVSEFIRFSLTNDNYLDYSGLLIPSLKNVKGAIVDEETQWAGFKSKVRNNYRKSLKKGLQVKLFFDPIPKEVIKDFYDIYIQTMRRTEAHNQYFHYIDYFEEIITQNHRGTIISMVFCESKPISAELILIDNDTLYSFLGGTLSEYFYTRPNDFLKIETINWARKYNYKYYVLGGGRVDDDSLYKYKKSFFPDDQDIIYYTGRKIINSEMYEKLVSKIDKNDQLEKKEGRTLDYFPLYRLND